MKIFFHLGYPRTGTTFLQTYIFPQHKQINFLGPRNYSNPNDIKISQGVLDQFSNFYFLRKTDNDLVKKTIKFFDKDKINIISTESYLEYINDINNFYDCKFIEELFLEQNVELSFIITLRNQYDLIKSIYYHIYADLSKFLNIKNFEKLVNLMNSDLENNISNFPLRLFLNKFNFNVVNNKLTRLFRNSKIKYLFYEDLKFNKDIFINNFCNFLDLNKTYTKNLFNHPIINQHKSDAKHDFVISPMMHKIINHKNFIAIKNKLPLNLKSNLKEFYNKKILYKKINKIVNEEKLKNIVKNYYKESNLVFFQKLKLENKFNY